MEAPLARETSPNTVALFCDSGMVAPEPCGWTAPGQTRGTEKGGARRHRPHSPGRRCGTTVPFIAQRRWVVMREGL
jgi:hypothetical protein